MFIPHGFRCCHDNRLYNTLPEVRQKKEEEMRQQRNTTNRERARQFHQVGCINEVLRIWVENFVGQIVEVFISVVLASTTGFVKL